MLGLYLFTALVGWAFVAFFIFFGGDADADVGELDFSSDVDLDVEIETEAPSGLATTATDFLSFRSAVFFLAFFGLTGLVLRALGVPAFISLPLAFAEGAFGVWLNTRLMRYLKRTNMDGSLTNRDLAGSRARVTLPTAPKQKGRVALDVGGQQIMLVAKPYRTSSFDIGDEVVVIQVANGIALISPLDEM